MRRKSIIFFLLFVSLAFVLASCYHYPRHPSDIRPGMTKEDVTRAWGGTYLITHQTHEGKQVEAWEYHFANTRAACRIKFYQDRVTTTECWRGPYRSWWY